MRALWSFCGLALVLSCGINYDGHYSNDFLMNLADSARDQDCSTLTATELNITGTQLTSIPTGWLDDFLLLIVLRIEGNLKLTQLPPLPTLNYLVGCSFSGNALLSLPNNFFTNAPTVGFLDLRNNNLTSIPVMPAGVQYALLGPNQISTLTSSSLNYPGLKQLYLRGNKFASVPVDAFVVPTNLTLLDLSDNKLTQLLPGTFSTLPFLSTLGFELNQLTSLPPDLLAGCPLLTKVYIGDNPLTSLPPTLLQNNTLLTDFWADNVPLTTLPAGFFDYCPLLNIVRLAGTKITTLDSGTFANKSRFCCLQMSNGSLTAIPAGLFATARGLVIANFTMNQITTVADDFLQQCPNVTILDLSYNKLTSFTAILNSSRLFEFHLDHNMLTTLPLLFQINPSVERLLLSNNQLNSLPAGIFWPLRNLRSLDLSNNSQLQIDSLVNIYVETLNLSLTPVNGPLEVFRNFTALRRLFLKGSLKHRPQQAFLSSDYPSTLAELDISENDMLGSDIVMPSMLLFDATDNTHWGELKKKPIVDHPSIVEFDGVDFICPLPQVRLTENLALVANCHLNASLYAMLTYGFPILIIGAFCTLLLIFWLLRRRKEKLRAKGIEDKDTGREYFQPRILAFLLWAKRIYVAIASIIAVDAVLSDIAQAATACPYVNDPKIFMLNQLEDQYHFFIGLVQLPNITNFRQYANFVAANYNDFLHVLPDFERMCGRFPHCQVTDYECVSDPNWHNPNTSFLAPIVIYFVCFGVKETYKLAFIISTFFKEPPDWLLMRVRSSLFFPVVLLRVPFDRAVVKPTPCAFFIEVIETTLLEDIFYLFLSVYYILYILQSDFSNSALLAVILSSLSLTLVLANWLWSFVNKKDKANAVPLHPQ